MLHPIWMRRSQDKEAADDMVTATEFKPYVLWITDEKGRLLDIEERWFDLTGLSREDSLGDGWLSACHPDDRARVQRAAYRSVTTGRPFEVQYRVRFADGDYRWVHSHARASRNSVGEIWRWHGATEHIEERVRAQARRHKLEIELEHATRAAAMSQIAGEIAHELSQPLAAAGSFLDGCERAMRDSARHGDDRLLFGLTKARDQIEHASAIVMRIRRFIQHREPQPEPIPVNEIVLDALALATAGDVEQLELGTDLNLDPSDPMILADRIELQQLLFNLVRNAIEAMETASRKELGISTAIRDHMVEIIVADTGAGLTIDPDDVFSPFLSTKREGLGLGLAICRTITERRGGEIGVVESTSSGTTFAVRFPCIAFGPRSNRG